MSEWRYLLLLSVLSMTACRSTPEPETVSIETEQQVKTSAAATPEETKAETEAVEQILLGDESGEPVCEVKSTVYDITADPDYLMSPAVYDGGKYAATILGFSECQAGIFFQNKEKLSDGTILKTEILGSKETGPLWVLFTGKDSAGHTTPAAIALTPVFGVYPMFAFEPMSIEQAADVVLGVVFVKNENELKTSNIKSAADYSTIVEYKEKEQ